MMSPAPIVSAGDAAGYYSNKDNYYFLGQLESEWLGEGASALGLEGPVRSDQLTAVLEGRLPDGSRLGKEVNGIHSHRPGHDLTFGTEKCLHPRPCGRGQSHAGSASVRCACGGRLR